MKVKYVFCHQLKHSSSANVQLVIYSIQCLFAFSVELVNFPLKAATRPAGTYEHILQTWCSRKPGNTRAQHFIFQSTQMLIVSCSTRFMAISGLDLLKGHDRNVLVHFSVLYIEHKMHRFVSYLYIVCYVHYE